MASRADPVPSEGRIPLGELGQVGDAGALAHYDDTAYYTKCYAERREDVAYYVELATRIGGPVLEYGVGNGRIALPMARAGLDVVGVDLSQTMLADFEARLALEPPRVRRRVKLVQGNMCDVRLRRRFPLVIAGFNTLLHLYTREEFEAFATRVKSHLAPEGQFVFDYSVPRASELARDPSRSYGSPRIKHPVTGEIVRYRERFEYDPLRQVLLVEMQFFPERSAPYTVPLTHRQYFPVEMEALLHYSGFTVVNRFADFSDQPPDEQVDSMVVICRASGSN